MTKRDILFRERPLESGFGDYMYERARTMPSATPDLSYMDVAAPQLNYDYDDRVSPFWKKLGDKLTNPIQNISNIAKGLTTGGLSGGAVEIGNAAARTIVGTQLQLDNSNETPDDYNLDDLFKDQLFSFLKQKDEVSIKSVEGNILFNLEDQIAKLEREKAYLNKMKDLELETEIYRSMSTPENSQNVDSIANEVNQLTPEYIASVQDRFVKQMGNLLTDAVNQYKGNTAENYLQMSSDARLEDVENQLQTLSAQRDSQYAEADRLRTDIWDRELGNNWLLNHKISDFYKQKEERTEFDPLSLDSWMFKVPGTMGSSFAFMEEQAAGIGASLLANMAKTTALREVSVATANPAIIGGANAVATVLDIAGAAATISSQLASRKKETYAELFDGYSQTVRSKAEQAGIDVQGLIEEAKQNLGDIPNAERLTDTEVFDLLVSARIPTSDESFNQIRQVARKNLDNQYNQNMALSAIDVTQVAAAIPFVGKQLSIIASPFKGAISALGTGVKASKVAKVLGKALDDSIEYGYKVAPLLKRATKSANMRAFGKYINKGIVARGLYTIGSEAYEEGSQYIATWKMMNDRYSDGTPSLFKGMLDNAESMYEATKAVLGIGNSVFEDDDEFFQNMIAGGMLGGLMGLPVNVAQGTTGFAKTLSANNYVRKFTADQIKSKEDFAKARMYADKTVLGKQSQIIQALEYMKDNLPTDGSLTAEDIDTEIARARNVMTIASSTLLKDVAKANKVKIGSEPFIDMVAIAENAYERMEDAEKSYQDLIGKYEAALSTDNYQHFGEKYSDNPEVASAFRNLARFNMERHGLTNLIDQLKKNKDLAEQSNANNSTTLNTDLIQAHIVKLESIKREQDKRVSELNARLQEEDSNFTADLIEDYSRDNSGENKVAKLYQMMALAEVAHDIAYEDFLTFNGIGIRQPKKNTLEVDTGESLPSAEKFPYGMLTKKEQKKVHDKFADAVKRYNNVVETTKQMKRALLDNTTETAPVITEVEDSINTPEITPQVDETQPLVIPTIESQTDTESNTETEPESAEEELPETDNSFNEQPDNSLNALLKRAVITEVPESGTPIPTESQTNPETTPEQPNTPIIDSLAEPITNVEATAAMNTPELLKAAAEFEKLGESNSAQVNAGITDGSLSKAVVANAGNDSRYGKTSHTLFYDYTSDRPMEKGFEPGVELSKLLADPGKAATLDYEFQVQNFYKTYKPEDESTWDDATIVVIITDPATGKKYMAAMKHPDTARIIHNQSHTRTPEEVDADINALRSIRNSIITAYQKVQQTGGRVVPTKTSISNGLFNVNRDANGNVVNRPIHEVKGLGVPTDPRAIDKQTVTLGIGGGVRAEFAIMTKEGNVLEGLGRSGKVYIYPANTPSGKTVNIKLNERQFGVDPEIVDLIFEMLVRRRAEDVQPLTETIDGHEQSLGFTPKTLLDFIIFHGKKTLLDEKAREQVPFLIPKQLYVNQQNDTITLGDKVYTRQALMTDEVVAAEFKNHIATMHWNMDKDVMWDKIFDTHPHLQLYFEITGIDKLVIIPSKIEFTMEDVGLKREDGQVVVDWDNARGLSWIAWYAKMGILQSDLQDQIFTAPFLYFDDVTVEEPTSTNPEIPAVKQEIVETTKQEETSQKPVDNSLQGLLKRATIVEAGEITSQVPELDDTSNVDLEVTDVDALLDSTDYSDFLGVTRTVEQRTSKTTIKKDKASKWLANKLGVDPIWTSQIIELAGSGVKAMGLMRTDAIVLWEGAEIGTEYHEAFHRVNLLLLSPEERAKVYESYRNRKNMRNVSEKGLEESLAEDFRDYRMSFSRRFSYGIRKIFNKILNWIGATRLITDTTIEDLYNKISTGYFRNVPINPANIERFKQIYEQGTPFTIGTSANPVKFKHIPTLHQYYRIINSLQSMLFLTNGVRSVDDISKLNASKLLAFLRGTLNSQKFNTQQKLVLAEVIEHWDAIWEDLKMSLENLGVRTIDRNRDNTQSEIDAGDVKSGELQAFDKASFEISKKSNALFTVKTFISQIVETAPTIVKDANGKEVIVNKAVLDPLTGLPTFIDFDTSWNRLMNSLYDVEFWSNGNGKTLINTVAKLAETIPFFKTLHNKLTKDPAMTEELKTQILSTVKSHKHNMFYIGYTNYLSENSETVKVGFRVGDSDTLRSEKMYPSVWSSAFFNNSGIIIRDANGLKINKPAVEKIVEKYNNLVAMVERDLKDKTITDGDLVSYKRQLIGILHSIGITIDIDVLNTVISNIYETAGINPFKAFGNLLTNKRAKSLNNIFNKTLDGLRFDRMPVYSLKNGKEQAKPLDKIFTFDSFITALSEAYGFVHPRQEEMSVLGAEGNLLYPIAENNYMSDMVRWLNADPVAGKAVNELVEKLNKVKYNASSIILSALSRGTKLQLNTFANFTEESVGDRGRDYTGISPLEDYISKMTLTWNNHIILPTMADKKTYFTLTGIKLNHGSLTMYHDGERQVIRLNDATLQQFLKYAKAEWETIKHYYSAEQQEILRRDPSKKVKNYHTKNKGGRFRHFKGVWLNVNGQPEWTSFNQILDKYDADGNIQEGLDLIEREFFSKESWFQLNAINENLKRVVMREIDTAINLGLISATPTTNGRVPKMTNRLLDERILEELITKYAASVDPAIKNNAETFAIYEMLADYATNSMMSITEFEKVFAKDPAFYSNTDDKIKRLGSVLSTGTNHRTDWEPGHRLNGRTQYTVTEVADVKLFSDDVGKLREMFEENYYQTFMQEIGWDKAKSSQMREAARIRAIAETSGYGNGSNESTDGTVIISPAMYRDIMEELGEWSPEIERAYDVMESGTTWLSNSKEYQEAMNALIKPLKMVYFGDHFDAELGLDIPIFDKMALFPMFKVLAIRDNLELYERMTGTGRYANEQPVDMVKFSSAVKVGSRAVGKFYTDDTQSEISNLSTWKTHQQEFKQLRRQLNTEPHTAERQLFGTQAAKAAISNLIFGRMYGNPETGLGERTGLQIRNEVFGVMNALSNLGAKRLMNRIGRFEHGEFVEELDKLSEMLINDAKQSGLPYDVLQGLETETDASGITSFKVPLSAMSSSGWIESRFLSLINKETVDISMPGGAYIQMASFGYKSISKVSDTALNGGRKLRFRNDDGSMDTMVSLNLLMHIVPKKFRTNHETARKWLLDNNVIGENAKPIAMGYRIPTQGLSSIVGLKVVDVLPAVVGDTIILPDEFTKLTGSDFDIDKLYVARYNYENNGTETRRVSFNDTPTSEETWDEIAEDLRTKGFDEDYITKEYLKWVANNKGKTKWELNSREANENRLLDMYMTMLTDNSNVNETRATLDDTTDYLKKTILKNVDGEVEIEVDEAYADLTPTFQLDKKYEYTYGKDGIAPFALNNVHHVLTQLTRLAFKSHKKLVAVGLDRLDTIYSRDTKKVRILDWLSAMINAHVDVAKDPYIIRLNIVPWTYNMTNLLLRTGVGENTFYFMPQAILKDIAQRVANSKGRYGVDRTKSASALEQDAINSVYQEYLAKAESLAETKSQKEMLAEVQADDGREINATTIWDTDWLLRQLKDGREGNKDFDWYLNQIRIYNTYMQLDPYAKGLSELVHTTQIDTKKFGNNFMLQKQFMYRVKRNILQNLTFDANRIKEFFKNTFLDTKLRNSVMLAQSLFKDKLIKANGQFTSFHNAVLSLIGQSDTNNERIINQISNALEASIKSKFFNQYAASHGIDVIDMMYGQNSMAMRLMNLKADVISGKYPDLVDEAGHILNEFINYIDGRPGNETFDGYNAPDFITTNALNEGDKYLQDRLKRYWQELLEHEDPTIKKFAEDLVVFAFLTSGDNYTMNGIFSLVPMEYRKQMGYAAEMQHQLDIMNDGLMDMDLDDVFKNNWYNGSIVPDVRMSRRYVDRTGQLQTDTLDHIMSAETIPGTELRYPLVIFNKRAMAVGINANNQPLFAPYIKYNLDGTKNPATTILYKYVGNYSDGDRIVPVYSAVSKKGLNQDSIVLTEYNSNKRSALAFNNLPRGNVMLSNQEGMIDYLMSSAEFPNQYVEKRLRDMLLLTQYIEDFNIADIANAVTYDQIMTEDLENINSQADNQANTTNTANIMQEFAETWSAKEGWSIEYFNKRVLPRIQAGGAYQLEYEYVPELADGETAVLGGKMTYAYSHNKAGYVTADTTLEAVKRGERTATTRYESDGNIAYWKRAEVGDILEFTDNNGDSVFVRVTKPLTKLELPITEIETTIPEISVDYVPASSADEATLHSGGAKGSDMMFEDIAEEFGLKIQAWSFQGHNTESIRNAIVLTPEQLKVANEFLKAANTKLLRKFPAKSDYINNLLRRNYYQVKDSEVIYAIGNIVNNQHGVPALVDGGTGWAVQMAIDTGKPVYVINTANSNDIRWMSYDYVTEKFVALPGEDKGLSHVPALPKNFAGIGSRVINDVATVETMVRQLFDKSFTTPEPTGNVADGTTAIDTAIEPNSSTGPSAFKFKDGFTIDTPFKLNQQQEAALLKLEEFYNSPGKFNNSITLTGYAGTGKSTIIGLFDKYIQHKSYDPPMYSAPTHRANTVTKANNPDANVKTLHSLLGLAPTVDLDNNSYDLKRLKTEQRNAPKISTNQLLIIDEASMIGKGLYDFLEDFKKNQGIKIIYVGDPAQLKPVENSNKGGKLSPVFEDQNITKIGLTKVERTGDTPVLEEATRLREGKSLTYTSKVNQKGQGVTYTNSDIEMELYMESQFTGDAFNNNPLHIRVLSATNTAIPSMNAKVRQAKFGENAAQIEVGDVLMGYTNWGITRKGKETSFKVNNGSDYIVTNVKQVTRDIRIPGETDNGRVSVSGFMVTFTNVLAPDTETSVFVLDVNTPVQIINQIIGALEEMNRKIGDMYRIREFGAAKNLEEVRDNFNNSFAIMRDYDVNGRRKMTKTFDYGYAHTIHKSQGGTYNNVILLDDTIDSFRDTETEQQLRYVGVTRARNHVMVRTNKPIIKQTPVTTQQSTQEVSATPTIQPNATVSSQIEPLFFHSRTKGLEVFSNFYGSPVRYNGVLYPTAEHAYQAAKTNDPLTHKMFSVAGNMTPQRAKSIGRTVNMRGDFEANKDQIMYDILKAKFEQNPGALKVLLETGTAELVHDTSDTRLFIRDDAYWGNGHNRNGLNKLGRILTQVRTELRATQTQSTPKPQSKIEVSQSKYTRESVKNDPNTLYIFTDNTDRTSGGNSYGEGWYDDKYGMGGYGSLANPTTAVIRGLDNAAPISTMRYFYRNHDNMSVAGARWVDANISEFVKVIDDEIAQIKKLWDSGNYSKIVIPTGGGFFNSNISNISQTRTPGLYKYLRLKLDGLSKYVNNQVTVPSIGINNTETTNNDPVNFNKPAESKSILSTERTVMTNAELRQMRPFTGSMPRIAVASEHTDPAFFSKRIIDILDGKESVEDKFKNVKYSGKDFAGLYIITKHDGLPIENLIKYDIPKIIHFSITGLGDTKWEPGVMRPNDLLDRIKQFLDMGLDPSMVTVRIDPIVPGITTRTMIENIVKRSSEMGITNIRFSVMDQYSTTKRFMMEQGYDYSKYYSGNSLHANQNIIDGINNFMEELADKYGVSMSTCAEPNTTSKISREACLSVAAVNNMLGTSIPETATGKQRQLCSCFGGKTDLLRYNNQCASSCLYCYAHHNNDKVLQYYNEDGSLKDMPLTRTSLDSKDYNDTAMNRCKN